MAQSAPPREEPLPKRPESHLAELTAQIAEVAGADVVICATETGELARRIRQEAPNRRVIAATPSDRSYRALGAEGLEVVRLPARVSDRYRQARLALGVAFREGRTEAGDVAVCAVGHRTSLGDGDLVLVTDIEDASAALLVSDLERVTNDIPPRVMNRILEIAGEIGRVVRRGRNSGALFVVGDSDRVLEGTRQLVMNPFSGHSQEDRMVTSSAIRDTLVELAKLDGAFIIRGDGLIRTAGAYLEWAQRDLEVPAGLGARHVAAAAVTARTDAAAVAVSETDGYVRVFADGKLVMQMDPDFTVL
ncbi:MAG: diadenylate cyclase [Actinomycetota bacterium]|nr:diadenylate cyclase [Actinomycetota bacterium]